MKIGCFALVEPFAPMARQFQAIREMGIRCADITDNHQGGMLGVEYGFLRGWFSAGGCTGADPVGARRAENVVVQKRPDQRIALTSNRR